MTLKSKIIRESIKVLIITAIISSFGGFALKTVEEKLIMFLPLLIIIPALNNMVGNFGIIIVSKFTTYLALRKLKQPYTKSHVLKHLFSVVLPVAIIASIYMAILVALVSKVKNFDIGLIFFGKLLLITLITALALIIIIFVIAIIGGFYVHKKNQDPDNLLIPITTSIADLGSMILFSILVIFLF